MRIPNLSCKSIESNQSLSQHPAMHNQRVCSAIRWSVKFIMKTHVSRKKKKLITDNFFILQQFPFNFEASVW